MKLNIAIAAGGDSAEQKISMLSAKTVYDNLDRNRFEVTIVNMRFGKWEAVVEEENYPIDKNDFSFEYKGKKMTFDHVFIAIHGTPGEDGKLQAYFDLLNIPYSSPNHIGATLTFNKWYCNTLLNQLGYNTANSFYLRKGENIDKDLILNQVGLPCFVKPCSSGSSYGISKVKSESELNSACDIAFGFDQEIMVESALEGREITCGVYQKKGEVLALPITEIIPKGEFFDFDAKYKGHSQEITPADISRESYEEVQQISKEIYRKLDMRGIIRIDYMLDGNTAYIIEMNAVPGLSPESLIPQQVKASNLSLSDFFTDIITETYKK